MTFPHRKPTPRDEIDEYCRASVRHAASAFVEGRHMQPICPYPDVLPCLQAEDPLAALAAFIETPAGRPGTPAGDYAVGMRTHLTLVEAEAWARYSKRSPGRPPYEKSGARPIETAAGPISRPTTAELRAFRAQLKRARRPLAWTLRTINYAVSPGLFSRAHQGEFRLSASAWRLLRIAVYQADRDACPTHDDPLTEEMLDHLARGPDPRAAVKAMLPLSGWQSERIQAELGVPPNHAAMIARDPAAHATAAETELLRLLLSPAAREALPAAPLQSFATEQLTE